jgi:hypothetical protein
METPFQTAMRLLAALEDLVEQESTLLHAHDSIGAVEIQNRTAPLVEKLAALAVDPEVTALQPRVAALIDRRQQNGQFLDTELNRLQDELRRVDEARSRLARLLPAYVSAPPTPSSRLNTAA